MTVVHSTLPEPARGATGDAPDPVTRDLLTGLSAGPEMQRRTFQAENRPREDRGARRRSALTKGD